MLRVELRCFFVTMNMCCGSLFIRAANYKWHMCVCSTQRSISFFGSHMLFLSCSLLLMCVICRSSHFYFYQICIFNPNNKICGREIRQNLQLTILHVCSLFLLPFLAVPVILMCLFVQVCLKKHWKLKKNY
jgi:hypothetical protein